MKSAALDLDAVRAFVLIVEHGSFTRAAEALETTQAAVSLKLKRLEARLGRRLVERTPRSVQLSAHGADFLGHARALLEAHDRAMQAFGAAPQRLALGISDHVAGPELPGLIARMNARDPSHAIAVRVGSSGELLQSFDRRELDAVLLRLHGERRDGKVVARERFGWFAAPSWQPRASAPLPIVTMGEPCGVRALAVQLLERHGAAYAEVFVGGGVLAVAAAVMAGLGIAALSPRMLPMDAVDVGPKLGLPELPLLPIVLHSRVKTSPGRDAVAALAAAYKQAVRG
ncbi:LysR family transcriptional regulator [Rhodopseudomonas palustris]|uniref:LysR family transcriptional regulator n=1 Tax=Rhodopseudomonas palustris TaxID=1076 RepID=A0AAX3DVX1_RHOPL|nr:LysR family transcriptional regulator [Rhodopseudomonas palustris]UYO38996.1 LysR family transcriptional regulator [Rhodopseudomonas palustris]